MLVYFLSVPSVTRTALTKLQSCTTHNNDTVNHRPRIQWRAREMIMELENSYRFMTLQQL